MRLFETISNVNVSVNFNKVVELKFENRRPVFE